VTLNARGLLIGTLAVCLATLATDVRGEPLRIDRVDSSNFATRNELVFFVDILDETTGEVVKGQDSRGEGVRFFFDDQEVKGEVRVETFRDANQVFAVAVLMAAHPDFAMEDPDPESQAPKVLKEQVEGFSSFFNDMPTQHRVSARPHHGVVQRADAGAGAYPLHGEDRRADGEVSRSVPTHRKGGGLVPGR